MRMEQDSMGQVSIPEGALWGAQTQRAVENFPISGIVFDKRFIKALGQVKRACALANIELGLLSGKLGDAIIQSCEEMIAGLHDDQFPVDVYQTGSGTSTNMNANEVIANRSIQLLGGMLGNKHPVHPNDHVNMSQSSNDIMPTVLHVAAGVAIQRELIPSLRGLQSTLAVKAQEFNPVVKTGRTHLQDAAPIRLGQEFGGYAAQLDKGIKRAGKALEALRELALGGTAVGSGLNCPDGFPELAIRYINQMTGLDFIEASNHFEANSARDSAVQASGYLKTIAVSLTKVANDIRWLGSGPRNGLGELSLPAIQPGSSIMPGKINPVTVEALIMACAQVIGFDTAIVLGGLGGHFELNAMIPLIAHNLLSSINLLSNASIVFSQNCVNGIRVNVENIQHTLERNLALATALAPAIGYDRAAWIANEAFRTGQTVREIASSQQILPPDELDRLLDPERMTGKM